MFGYFIGLLTLPIRNWNFHLGSILYSNSNSFDSTYKELKLSRSQMVRTIVLTFDSTYKELKLSFVGLKSNTV